MYQIIDQNNNVYIEKEDLISILKSWSDFIETLDQFADITYLNNQQTKALVDWYYPDRVSDKVQIIKEIK